MKRSITFITALLVIAVMPYVSKAQNILKLENNTPQAVWAAYATYDGSCWVCFGWVRVEKYNTFDVPLGDYNGQIFVHGENRSATVLRNWGDNDMLCVEEGEVFRIRCPRNKECRVKKMFALINSSPDGVTKFIFNP